MMGIRDRLLRRLLCNNRAHFTFGLKAIFTPITQELLARAGVSVDFILLFIWRQLQATKFLPAPWP